MKHFATFIFLSTMVSIVFASSASLAQNTADEDLITAIVEGDAQLMLRYRWEQVEQDNLDKTANASTLLTRLTYTTEKYQGFFAKLEVDNVSAIFNENYNSTVNGNTQYPVVADPSLSEVNQAFLGFKAGNTSFTAGRQRINHNNQRFVGGVAWRQNEQTFDAYRLVYQNQSGLKLDYSFSYNVNRIFGPDSPNADLQGNLHLFNANYALSDAHTLTAFAYELDFEDALAISTRTLGASYEGSFENMSLSASYANQQDTGDNPTSFSANYLAAELGGKISRFNVAVGYESLGSNNGVGFSTPLATLHKFQGFADKFLATPANGVKDLYVKAATKIDKLSLVAVYHKLESDVGNIDFGKEFNFVAKYPVHKNISLLVKYARYSADERSVDTNKLWTMLTAKF